ncbi:MAG: hypothetical protein JWP97_1979 [Labilithrix sp.]|nr:hypothetical protein [Labilithrix sp.]
MKTFSVLPSFVLLLVAGCGIENALVGGRCREGFVLDGDVCVATPADAPPSQIDQAPLPDGAVPDAEPTPADGGSDGGDIVAVKPPYEVDAGNETTCTPPLVFCAGRCISVESDPLNCGACGKVCASNICVAGECQGATPGDVVLVGHDYTNASPGSAQTRVLVNAMSIPTTDPIRVLSFEDGASPAAVAQLKYLATAGISRKIKFTHASSPGSLTSSALSRFYDIVIIHDASAVDPAAVGPTWAGPLGSFAKKGGVVLAVDVGDSPMPELLTSANLLTVGAHTTLPEASHLLVTGASDVIGAGVLSPYAAFGPPVSFQGVSAPGADITWVVRHQASDGSAGDPVVVHRSVR